MDSSVILKIDNIYETPNFEIRSYFYHFFMYQ